MTRVCVLGIESSCDETAASVVDDGVVVRSNVIASQHDLHEEYGGVVPEIASRAHVERILPVIRAALREAGATLTDLDAIAVGHRPGLIGSLLVGVAAAKALAWSLGKPLIGVDHIEAHLYAGLLGAPPGIEGELFPALGLVVSGGHTALYRMRSPLEMERLGGTIDDAVGEAYDKVASMLGLPHPGGPKVDALAQDGNDRAVDFPISRLSRDSLDFSFSGLKTAVLYEVKGVPGQDTTPPPLTDRRKADIAASFQRAAVEALLLKLSRAAERLRERGDAVRTLLVGGGVSANSRLRSALNDFAAREAIDLRLPAMDYCLDNAAMIAGLGACRLRAGLVDDLSLSAEPNSAWSDARR